MHVRSDHARRRASVRKPGRTDEAAPNERHCTAPPPTLMSHATTTLGATEFHEAVKEAEYAAVTRIGPALSAWESERSRLYAH